MFEGMIKSPFKKEEKKIVFDMTKYYVPFLTDQSIRNMADQVASVDIPRSPWMLSLIFMAIKVSALSTLYGMWTKNKENQMVLDKQAFSSQLSQQLGEDNEVL